MKLFENIVIKPVLTEKSDIASEKNQTYTFLVNVKSNKHQIKNAIETLYDVKVKDVNTSVMPGKLKRTSKGFFKTQKKKKAYVKIEDGQKIKFFEAV